MLAPPATRENLLAGAEDPMQPPAVATLTAPSHSPKSLVLAEETIDFTWKQYRRMDFTSVRDKRRWLWVKRLILALTLVLIVLLPIGQAFLSKESPWVSLLTWFCAVLAALIAFANQFVGAAPHQRWIRARAAAESIKSEVFRFVGGPLPTTRRGMPRRSLLRYRSSWPRWRIPSPRRKPRRRSARAGRASPPLAPRILPSGWIDQIRFFDAKAVESDSQARQARQWTRVLSGMAVVAGASAPFLKDLSRIDGWIPVLSVLSATLATQLYLSHSEFQASLYQSARVQLEFMKRSWLLVGEEDTTQQAKQVAWFEEALAKINGTWLSEWTRRQDLKPEKPAAEPPPRLQGPDSTEAPIFLPTSPRSPCPSHPAMPPTSSPRSSRG